MSTGVAPERDVLASRLAYLTVGLPTVGTVAAVLYAVFDGLWLSDVLLFVGMYLITEPVAGQRCSATECPGNR